MLKIVNLKNCNLDEVKSFISNKISIIDHELIISDIEYNNNLTFCILENTNLVAVIPFYIKYDEIHKINVCQFNNVSIPGPLISKDLSQKKIKTLFELIFNEIDSICQKKKVNNIKINFSDLIDYNTSSATFFNLKDYIDKYNYNYCGMIVSRINLLKPICDIIKNFSKGHKSIIKKIGYKYQYRSFRDYPISLNEFKKFFENKIKNEKLSEALYFFYKEDKLELTFEFINNEYKFISAFFKSNKNIQYYIANSDNISSTHHNLIFDSICHYKSKNFNYLNLGIINKYSIPWYKIDEKKRNISIFKRGFGGDRFDLYIVEKNFFHKKI